MPNIGRPSKACTNCKRRKVKCSETPPECRGCAKLGLSCEWKEVPIFRRQEDWAERLVTRRVKQAKILRGDVAVKPLEAVAPLALERPLPKQMTFDVEGCALNRFYFQYAYTSGTCPFLYLVPTLYEQSSTPACLQSAVRAVSLASMARQLKRHEIMGRAQQYYGKALYNLASALVQPEVAKHDGTLLAISLLDLYETAVYAGTECHGELNRIHSEGRLAILRLRGPEQLQSKIGRNLFTLVYHQQLVKTFFHSVTVMEEYPIWMKDWYPASPVATLETLMHEVSFLVSKVKVAVDKGHISDLQGYLHRGKEIEDTLATIVQEHLESWPVTEDILGRLTGNGTVIDLPQQLEFDVGDLPEDLDRYTCITRALVANIFRAVRIHLLKVLSFAASQLLAAGYDLSAEYRMLAERSSVVLVQVAECICNDVFLAIGDHGEGNNQGAPRIYGHAIRAWSQLFPLESALSVDSLSDKQIERLGETLEYCKRIVGIDLGAGMGYDS